MNDQITAPSSLSYGIRPRVIVKYLGHLFLISACISSIPLLASIIFQDYAIALVYLVVISIFACFGFFSRKVQAPQKLQYNEAYVIVALIFLLSSFVFFIPMAMQGIPWMDAWFETVSGITTTGLSTLSSVEKKADTFLFFRSWMQWYGGLGIVVLSMGLAMQPSSVAKKLSTTFTDREEIVGSTKAHARKMFIVYVVLTLFAIGALWIAGLPFFPSLLLAFSSVSTGGFSPFDTSLQNLPNLITYIILFFSVAGAISFPLYWIPQKKQLKALFGNIQLWTILICALIAALVYFLFSHLPVDQFGQAIFQAFSAQSTAGYATTSIAELDSGSKLVLIGSMMIGGSSFSTAGGFKVFRLLILLKALQRIFFKTTLSKHAVYENSLSGYAVDSDERENCFGIIFFFLTSLFFSWLCFVGYGYDPLDSLFEITSALGTVGLSSGITSSELPFFLKGILCIDMFLGRLEFLTFLILFYPRTIFGRRMQA